MSGTQEMKLEVVVIPVSDVDRSKRFYGGLGWRLDADFVRGNEFRVVQFTPPGSPCSIHFGQGVTTAVPGSVQTLYLVVSDIVAARAELLAHGAAVSDVTHRVRPGEATHSGPHPQRQSYASFASFKIRTATGGCSRRSLRDCPDVWTRTTRHSPHRPSLRRRCAERQPRTASTKSASASETRTGRIGMPSTW